MGWTLMPSSWTIFISSGALRWFDSGTSRSVIFTFSAFSIPTSLPASLPLPPSPPTGPTSILSPIDPVITFDCVIGVLESSEISALSIAYPALGPDIPAPGAPSSMLLIWKWKWYLARLTRIFDQRSEEHTSELQSLAYLVCRLLLEKKTLSPS